jgi:hypothetical protein
MRTEYRSPSRTVTILCYSLLPRNMWQSPGNDLFIQAYLLPRKRVSASHCLATEVSAVLSDCTLPAFKCHITIQCVHKVPSGFWKILARSQIVLATCGLRQIIVKLDFFPRHWWHKRPSLSFSVTCLWNGDCAGTRALCGMAFWDKISHPDLTKLPHTVQ